MRIKNDKKSISVRIFDVRKTWMNRLENHDEKIKIEAQSIFCSVEHKRYIEDRNANSRQPFRRYEGFTFRLFIHALFKVIGLNWRHREVEEETRRKRDISVESMVNVRQGGKSIITYWTFHFMFLSFHFLCHEVSQEGKRKREAKNVSKDQTAQS